MTSSSPIAIIWLHGLGDTEEGWSEQLQEDWTSALTTSPSKISSIKWKFPRAPEAKVTCNGGMRMTSWFDIESLPIIPGAKDYPDDIKNTIDKIHTEIDKMIETENISPNRIFVGGFSQGGAITMLAGLSYPKGPLAGCINFSGWLMTEDSFKVVGSESDSGKQGKTTTPLLWWHGSMDNVVSYPVQAHGIKKLEEKGVEVTARTERYAHSGHPLQAREVPKWILSKISG